MLISFVAPCRWLPPPVLAMLDDKEIEAAKLGAMLTTALQWLLNNVPRALFRRRFALLSCS